MTEKRFTVHIKWFNYDKTEGEIELFDNGQPLLVSECIEDVQMIKELLNELGEENDVLKQQLKTKHIVNKQYEELQRLKEENKELKQNIEVFKMEIAELREAEKDNYNITDGLW